MGNRRSSAEDDACLRRVLGIISGTRITKRVRGENIIRKLPPNRYSQLMAAVETQEAQWEVDGQKRVLRLDYSPTKKKVEIWQQTVFHGGMELFFGQQIDEWRSQLAKSENPEVRAAALGLAMNRTPRLEFTDERGLTDLRTPDWEVRHLCKRRGGRGCRFPAWVLEVSWTHTKEELDEKAEFLIRRSNGEIRTVVALYMREMHLAELKNEKRLPGIYRKGKKRAYPPYYYPNDEDNETGCASVMVWRGRKDGDGTVRVKRTQDKIFRSPEGEAVQAAPLQITLNDLLCEEVANSLDRRRFAGAVPLTISSNMLFVAVDNLLIDYREFRWLMISDRLYEETEQEIRKEMAERWMLMRGAPVLQTIPEGEESIPPECVGLGRVGEGKRVRSARIRARG